MATNVRLTDWGTSNGMVVSYDQATNEVVIEGVRYKPNQIPGTRYEAGRVLVTNAKLLLDDVYSKSSNTVTYEESPQKVIDDADGQWTLAKQIREQAPAYKTLFEQYGMTFTDDIADKLFKGTEDSGQLYQQIFDMERLADFEKVHRFYLPDAAFSLDLAKGYEKDYENAGGLENFFKAKEVFTARGDEYADMLATWLGKTYTGEQMIGFLQGKPGAATFEEELERANKIKEGALKKERAQTNVDYDKLLASSAKSFI